MPKPIVRQHACNYMVTVQGTHVVALAFPGGEAVHLSLSEALRLANDLNREYRRGNVAVSAKIDAKYAQPKSGGAG